MSRLSAGGLTGDYILMAARGGRSLRNLYLQLPGGKETDWERTGDYFYSCQRGKETRNLLGTTFTAAGGGIGLTGDDAEGEGKTYGVRARGLGSLRGK